MTLERKRVDTCVCCRPIFWEALSSYIDISRHRQRLREDKRSIGSEETPRTSGKMRVAQQRVGVAGKTHQRSHRRTRNQMRVGGSLFSRYNFQFFCGKRKAFLVVDWAHLCMPSTALAACSPLESVASLKKSSPSSTAPDLAI